MLELLREQGWDVKEMNERWRVFFSVANKCPGMTAGDFVLYGDLVGILIGHCYVFIQGS